MITIFNNFKSDDMGHCDDESNDTAISDLAGSEQPATAAS